MSIALMTRVWKTALPCGRKMVLLALCDNANDQGECYPSVSMLADKCSMGERTVQQHITDLETDGLVRRALRGGRSTVYYINASRFSTPADSAPPPPQISHPTPADFAPITVNEPSFEPSLKRGERTAKSKTALPANWQLSQKMGEWALAEYPHWSADDVRKVADKFHDHWLSVGGIKKDWEATWRNWCRNECRAWTSTSRASATRGYESEKDKARRAVVEAISGKGAGQYGRIIDIGRGTAFGSAALG